MFDPKRAEQLDRIEATLTEMNKWMTVLAIHLDVSEQVDDNTNTMVHAIAARDHPAPDAAPGPSVDQSDFTYCGCQHECFRAYGKSVGKLPCTCTRSDVHAHVEGGQAVPLRLHPPERGAGARHGRHERGGLPGVRLAAPPAGDGGGACLAQVGSM